MFTFCLIYTVFYLFTILSILLLVFSEIPLHLLTNSSTPNFIIFLQKYKISKSLYLWLFFCLTGLPPVGLFIVKFNILLSILYQTHIFTAIVFFFFFLINMLYYTQLFNFRNFKKPMYHVVTPLIFERWGYSPFNKNCESTYNSYLSSLFVVTILFFLTSTIIFFNDFFLILNIL